MRVRVLDARVGVVAVSALTDVPVGAVAIALVPGREPGRKAAAAIDPEPGRPAAAAAAPVVVPLLAVKDVQGVV